MLTDMYAPSTGRRMHRPCESLRELPATRACRGARDSRPGLSFAALAVASWQLPSRHVLGPRAARLYEQHHPR